MRLNLLKVLKENFRIKIFITFALLIFFISTSFTSFFIYRQTKNLTDALIKKGNLLAGVLAFNSRIGIFSENKELLDVAAEGILRQEGVLEVSIFNLEGKLLKSKERPQVSTLEKSIGRDEKSRRKVIEEIRETLSPYFFVGNNAVEFWSPVISDSDSYGEVSLFFEENLAQRKAKVIGFAMITEDRRTLNKEINDLLIKTIFMGIAFLIIGFVITYRVVKGITKPLNKLIESVEIFGTVGTVEKFPIETEDEIGKLAMALNNMAESLKRREEALRESEERFRRIFDEGFFGMNLTNPDNTIAMVNKAFCEFLGYTEQELTGQSIADITYEEDREKNRELTGQLFVGAIPMFRLEKRYIRKDGTILWANIAASAIHGKEGNVLYALVIIQDLTEIKKAAEKIHLLHYYDSLTGLPNRTFYKELIKRSIEHAHRQKEKFAIIYIGLDNFQRINETLGHSYGDLLLKAVADKLTDSLRESDYVARSGEGEAVDVVSRVGADEFIVLAHDFNQAQDAAIASRRLLKEISEPVDLNGREVFLTASIGIALYPNDGTDVDSLLKNAEKAMRYTKSEGKNNYHFYSESMNSFVLELLSLESDLHKALERDELMLYYQPKVDSITRVVTGMEALIRWAHPDKGLIPPVQFIPLAETSGLIIPIGEFVIRTVCKQIKAWQEAGYKQINISLNVSSRQFDEQNLIEVVKAAIQNTMIPPPCLELEITESTIMRNTEKAIRTLTELKAMGVRIAIDDFGTGYSSLSYLKRLPLDFLKIDMSFIKNLVTDPSDQAIVRAIIAMAHSLNLKTIAEGVETEEQLSFLKKHGCDEIQGYLFGRPLPVDKITKI